MEVVTQERSAEHHAPWAVEVGSGASIDSAIVRLSSDRMRATSATTALAVTIAIVGFGNVLETSKIGLLRSTGGQSVVGPRGTRVPQSVVSLSQKIVAVKERLGLTIKSMATILGVQRPTIYSWLNDGAIRASNRERVEQIYALSEAWVARTKLPLAEMLLASEHDEKNLLGLLSDEKLDVPSIIQKFDQLIPGLEANEAEFAAESMSQRLRNRGFGPPPSKQGPYKDSPFRTARVSSED